VDLSPRQYSKKKRVGEFLGFSFAESNPRKHIKRAGKPLGNLPLEILAYLQGYVDAIIENGTLKAPCFQMQSSRSRHFDFIINYSNSS
jgi:putative membrane protein